MQIEEDVGGSTRHSWMKDTWSVDDDTYIERDKA